MAATATKEEISRFSLKAGDVLITKDSESWNDIAVPAVVDGRYDRVLCGYHLALIRPQPQSIESRYLARAFESAGIREQFHVEAQGITRFGLSGQSIGNALVPVPPYDEQHRIADFLDRETAKIDALIARNEAQIRLLKERYSASIALQNPEVLAGRATIRGLRISVAHVVNLVANGMRPAQIVEELPDLEEGDVRQALAYAAAIT